MGLPAPVIGRVRVAARLHDLGKVWISRDILDKPGPLTERSGGEIRHHPRVAARLFRLADLHDLADIVLAYERPDASGYPEGIPSGDTPLEAQVMAVADVYDAMLSQRPYAAARAPEEARKELERVSAKQGTSMRTSSRRSCGCWIVRAKRPSGNRRHATAFCPSIAHLRRAAAVGPALGAPLVCERLDDQEPEPRRAPSGVLSRRLRIGSRAAVVHRDPHMVVLVGPSSSIGSPAASPL